MKKILFYILHPINFLVKLAQYRIIYLSDKLYLQLAYKAYVGKKLNLKNPQTFNEKLQWLKLNDRKDIYTTMVDKCEAKKYVANIIGDEYIVPTIGVYNSFDEIDFDQLPNQFVMKCNHDSGTIVICRNKKNFDIESARKKITESLKKNYFCYSREWPYKNVKPKIIIEKYMQDQKYIQLRDYKFYCFNGSPEYLYVSEGLENHTTAKISFYDMNFKRAPFGRTDYNGFDSDPVKPINFDRMKNFAKILSRNTYFLRVDFYEINGKVYFGELTFYPCGGFMPFYPSEYDKILGDMITLPIKKEEKNNEK